MKSRQPEISQLIGLISDAEREKKLRDSMSA
jgi:hypothetical protein